MKKQYILKCIVPWLSLFLLIIVNARCKKACDLSLRKGELVQIPIEFVGFTLSEINQIAVYRVDKWNTSSVDTFQLWEILWAHEARNMEELITDNTPLKISKNYGDYESYFDHCNLVFNWQTGRDTLADIVIKKSKENSKGCHANDPNIRIDILTCKHKGSIKVKNESIRIAK